MNSGMLSTLPISLNILSTAYISLKNKLKCDSWKHLAYLKHNMYLCTDDNKHRKSINFLIVALKALSADYLICSTMKRTIQGSNSSSEGCIHVNTTANADLCNLQLECMNFSIFILQQDIYIQPWSKVPCSCSGAIHFMFCMQYEKNVENTCKSRIWFVRPVTPVCSIAKLIVNIAAEIFRIRGLANISYCRNKQSCPITFRRNDYDIFYLLG